jgi:preprotein translocase subunit YajC
MFQILYFSIFHFVFYFILQQQQQQKEIEE